MSEIRLLLVLFAIMTVLSVAVGHHNGAVRETIFDNVKVDIVKNNVAVKVQLKNTLLNDSSILQTVQIA